jgi:hypothetical protein
MRSFLVVAIRSNSDCSANTHLEFDLHQVVSGLVEAKLMVMLWKPHIHCPGARHVVIQASSNKDRPERLVAAYQDKNCLPDLMPAPSIFGLGFASRDEALANLEGHMSEPLLRNNSLKSQQCFICLMKTVTCRAGAAS